MSTILTQTMPTEGEFDKNPPFLPEPPVQIPFEGIVAPREEYTLPLPSKSPYPQSVFNFTIGTVPQLISLPEHNHMHVQNAGAVTIRYNEQLGVNPLTWAQWIDTATHFIYDDHKTTQFYLVVDAGTCAVRITVWQGKE